MINPFTYPFLKKRFFRHTGDVLKNVITNAIEPYGAKIVSYFYDEKCFGNIILSIENKDGRIFNFYLDRGYTYLDGGGKEDVVYVMPEKPDGGFTALFNFARFVVNKVSLS